MTILVLTSAVQAALFEYEIKGQLSDGAWENARPLDHWHDWTNVTVVVGGHPGRNFYPNKTTYDLEGQLVLVVGDRMRALARLAMIGVDVELVRQCLDGDGNWIGAPTYAGKWYDGIREQLAQLDLTDIKSRFEAAEYSTRELRRDLRSIKEAMKTFSKEGAR
jgi:hypothetical protein